MLETTATLTHTEAKESTQPPGCPRQLSNLINII